MAVNGIFISEDGEVQVFGTLSSVTKVIPTLEQLIPQLKEQQIQMLVRQLGPEQVEQIKHLLFKVEDKE